MTSPPTGPSDRRDVVGESVATYSERPEVFARYSATAVAGPFSRFASLLAPGSTVLDAGCGPGRDLDRLADLGHKGLGVDLNRDFVKMALLHAPAVRGDLRRLPFVSRSFDAVWASASLIHLPGDDVALALDELARVARRGARFCASVKTAGVTGWAEDPPHGVRWFSIWSPEEFTEAVRRAGLTIEAVSDERGWVDVCARA